MGANSVKQSNAIMSGFYNSKLVTKNVTNQQSASKKDISFIQDEENQVISETQKSTIRPQSSNNVSRLGYVKTMKQKQEERILDIDSVINEVKVDQLEAKYDRIKKLRNEFNDIKSQFSSQLQAMP